MLLKTAHIVTSFLKRAFFFLSSQKMLIRKRSFFKIIKHVARLLQMFCCGFGHLVFSALNLRPGCPGVAPLQKFYLLLVSDHEALWGLSSRFSSRPPKPPRCLWPPLPSWHSLTLGCLLLTFVIPFWWYFCAASAGLKYIFIVWVRWSLQFGM